MADVENRSLGISLGPNTGSSQQRATERAVDRFAGPAKGLQSYLQQPSQTQGIGTTARTFSPPTKSTEPITSLNLENILNLNTGETGIAFQNHIYDFELFLINNLGKILSISPTAIQNLTIYDTITEIGSSGSIIINYDNDRIEYFDEFIFRNDGEDFLRLRMIPKDITTNLPGNASIRSNNTKLWELNFIFSIYDVHDVTPKTNSNTDASTFTKMRKLFFRDIRKHYLQSVNIEYSTALSENAGVAFNPEDLSDKNRSIPTGLCINEIIKQSFNYDPILSQTGLEVNPSQDWDLGSTDIFVTSGAAENSYELLMSIYNRHVSENIDDFSLLRIERNEKGIGYFTLKPLQSYFKDAGQTADTPGKLQIEHFFLKNSLDEQNAAASLMFKAPILQNADGTLKNDMIKDIKINDFNTINKYEFVDISPSINTNFFNSRCVYSFDFAKRQFNIEFDKHSVNSVTQTINDKYINNLYKAKGANNFLINNTSPIKQTNKNIYPHYSLYGNSDETNTRLPDGFQKLLKTGLLQNTCISFTVPGLTIRQAGTFVGIDRLQGSRDNPLDNKLCGQWFVIDVKHIIAANMYYNTITAVKIHGNSSTSQQRATERAVDRFAGPARSLQSFLPSFLR
jgi:hypothetical protein